MSTLRYLLPKGIYVSIDKYRNSTGVDLGNMNVPNTSAADSSLEGQDMPGVFEESSASRSAAQGFDSQSSSSVKSSTRDEKLHKSFQISNAGYVLVLYSFNGTYKSLYHWLCKNEQCSVVISLTPKLTPIFIILSDALMVWIVFFALSKNIATLSYSSVLWMPLFIFTILNLFLHVATLKHHMFFVAENEQILVTEDDFPEVKVDFQVTIINS